VGVAVALHLKPLAQTQLCDDATGTIDASNYNTGLGIDVFASLTTGDNNTAIGYKAGTSLASGHHHNTFVGANAGENSTGVGNMAIGSGALAGWGGASYMTAIGFQALGTNNGTDTATRNVVAIGTAAMQNLKDWSQVPSLGGDSVAVGDYAHQGTADTYAYRNTAIGFKAMQGVISSSECVAIGYQAGMGASTSGRTIAIGGDALKVATANNTGTIAIGYGALRSATINNSNTAIGMLSQGVATAGNANVSLGMYSFSALTVAYQNTAIGNNSAQHQTTGRNTVALGYLSGQVLTTGYNNIYIGVDTHASANNVDNEIVIGSKRDGYNTVDIVGKGSSTGFIAPGLTGAVYQGNNSASWATTSDRRIKKNIEDNNTGLEAIKQIQVRNFEYRTQDEITDFENPASAAVRKEGIQLGVIAQEIETILPDVVKEESTGVKSVNPDNITWYLVNAVKELSAQVEELKKKVGE
jgi:trimeric autotransporter adhesin